MSLKEPGERSCLISCNRVGIPSCARAAIAKTSVKHITTDGFIGTPPLEKRTGGVESTPYSCKTRSVSVRIASLLPSATEIVCALGARAGLVGRSHECDFPARIEEVPLLTSARIAPLPSSKAIDPAVRHILAHALAIYQIPVERLREARPNVIVTQALWEGGAVSLDDVR